MQKVDLDALIASHIKQATAPGGVVEKAQNKKAKERVAKRATAKRKVENATSAVSKAKQAHIEEDKKLVLAFIDEVSPRLPAFCESLSDGNGYKAVFNFYKNDGGKYSVQILRNSSTKAERILTDHTLAQNAQNKTYRDEKLLKELRSHPDGFKCANETMMMKEIIRLRNIIEGMRVLADAERQAREAE